MTRDQKADIAGWYGSAAVLAAYGLLVSDTIGSETVLYLALNVTGSLGLAYLAWVKRARPAVVLNLIWAAIGLVGFVI
jgi:hypothetical protein